MSKNTAILIRLFHRRVWGSNKSRSGSSTGRAVSAHLRSSLMKIQAYHAFYYSDNAIDGKHAPKNQKQANEQG